MTYHTPLRQYLPIRYCRTYKFGQLIYLSRATSIRFADLLLNKFVFIVFFGLVNAIYFIVFMLLAIRGVPSFVSHEHCASANHRPIACVIVCRCSRISYY